MTLLGIRVCQVFDPETASQLADLFLDGLGIVPLSARRDGENGVVFPTADHHSWAEIRPASDEASSGVFLQFVVDDADAYADKARDAGLVPHGPTDAHGERVYRLVLPSGAALSFQSRIKA